MDAFKKEDLFNALSALKYGTILYPTDTIWGIGCDAVNAEAVRKIYAIKKRAESKSMILGVDSAAMIQQYVLPEKFDASLIKEIIEKKDRPTTIVLQGAINLPNELIAEDGSAAFRIINEPFCKTLINEWGRPIVSTSANTSGNPSPFNFSEVEPEIRSSVDYIVQYRQLDTSISKPSRIVMLNSRGEVKIIRE